MLGFGLAEGSLRDIISLAWSPSVVANGKSPVFFLVVVCNIVLASVPRKVFFLVLYKSED